MSCDRLSRTKVAGTGVVPTIEKLQIPSDMG